MIYAGAGESTIIKLVINLSAREEENFTTPVIGSIGKDVPTSGDVHLYLDPQTADSEAPILYADCEGLDEGEREPLRAFRNVKDRSTSNQAGSIGENHAHLQHASARDITWATTIERRSRGFAVTNLYPHLPYSFSGVIVFVLKNPRYPSQKLREVYWTRSLKLSNQGHRECLRKLGKLGRCGFGKILGPASAATYDCHSECFRE